MRKRRKEGRGLGEKEGGRGGMRERRKRRKGIRRRMRIEEERA